MPDAPTEGSTDGARMMIEPDAVHESGGQIFLDCPQCGSNISIVQVVNEGRCTGTIDKEFTEVEDDTQLQEGCNAKLSLELVWES